MASTRASQSITMQAGEPIAIVGTGCRFPGGASSPSKLWEMLLDKRDALRAIPIDRWNSDGFHHSNGERAGALNVKHAYLLKENVREWDASFFGINPREAEAVDPQHRILLETVYEAMESGGFTMEHMQGSDTAVYVGVMTADYYEMLLRSPESLPTYFATGTNSSILSNRLSYFYDLKGPSETINTACSSSLVAVHRGVQSLRSGEARMAIAGGANLILNPEFMATESNLHMLSAEGRSRMWDAGANGYARGEGFAAVIMKRLSDAIADGDDITCIIRETGVNSDGRTKGITLPSGEAQTSLIQQVYRKAGLNPYSALDRPQYFEAHGTGTPAGDPIEANGIRDAFFAENIKREGENLLVGSVKTAMGHTEGTAGLAGLIKTANAIKLGVIPGNLLFQSYNPKILPLLDHLALATETQTWPVPPVGQPRRASVNCFGFGGTNAHAIIESYHPSPALVRKQLMPASTQAPMAIPLVLSANNEASLAAMVSNYHEFIQSNDLINLNDLAWTLQNRRSELALKTTFAGPTKEALLANMAAAIGKTKQSPPVSIGQRREIHSRKARILGVFTGQGAQWANMGRELMLSSTMARASIIHLDAALGELPDGPHWTLEDVICETEAGKRIDEAEFSQPVCTAVQVMLVDILRSAGHTFTAVIGHSSGEIGAAYACGAINASEAIKIAYYRGLHTKLAQGPSGKEGTMLAAGLSHEDADEFCSQPTLAGRIQVAASNAPESVTLSGDIDAVKDAKTLLDSKGIFARALKVNKAYHSQHMNPVSGPYMASLRACRIRPKLPSGGCTWVSSVTGDPIVDEMDLKALTSVYWKDNMLKPVLFSTAIEQAVLGEEAFDLAIEVGPHTALKGPFLQTYKAATGSSLPYGGTLSRSTNDISAMSNCLGELMNYKAPSELTTDEYIRSFQAGIAPVLATGLPTYAWDHSQIYWGETRYSRKYRQRSKPRHDLLGAQLPDDLEHDMRYRNTIRVSETPWLAGHKVQGQIVYPGAAYLVMALEASKDLAKDQPKKLVELLDIELSRAIALEEGSAGVDTLLTLKKTHEGPLNGENFIEAEFSIFSAIGVDAETWDLNMKGRIRIVLADSDASDIILPMRDDTPVLLSSLNVESFYNSLVEIGFNYTGLFNRLTSIDRRMNRATASAIEYPEDAEMPAMMHPALMDASFQTIFAALHFPGDGGMASPYLPTGIKCLRIITARDESAPATPVTIDTFITSNENMKIVADIEMCDSATGVPRLQIEGLACTSLDRLSWNHQRIFQFIDHLFPIVENGQHPSLRAEWAEDDCQWLEAQGAKHLDQVDIQLITTVGQNLLSVVRGETNLLECMMKDDMLNRYYALGQQIKESNVSLSRAVGQVVHRYAGMKILEVGGGHGYVAKGVLEEIGHLFKSYTFTDSTDVSFDKARESLQEWIGKMRFQPLEIEGDVTDQGFEEHSFDLIIASNVVQTSQNLQRTMENIRLLLKPGGYVVLQEISVPDVLRVKFMTLGLPAWWSGDDDSRRFGPAASMSQWTSLLKETGFSGVDQATNDLADRPMYMTSVVLSQALSKEVQFLREPLCPPALPIALKDICIIGGNQLRNAEITSYISDSCRMLVNELPRISYIDSIEKAQLHTTPLSSVIFVQDLDVPIWKDLKQETITGLRSVVNQARQILWVTSGCRLENAYANMSVGVGRGMQSEYAHVKFQLLDIEPSEAQTSNDLIAAASLRLFADDAIRAACPNILWTAEPELIIKNGKFLIPRITADQVLNDRLNARRRPIHKRVSPAQTQVMVSESNGSYVLSEPHMSMIALKDTSAIKIKVTHSLLSAVKVGENMHMYLSIGKVVEGGDIAKGKDVLAFSNINASIIDVPASQVAPIYVKVDSPPRFIESVASTFVSTALFSKLRHGSTVLFLGPDKRLAAAFQTTAEALGLKTFSASTTPIPAASKTVYINPHTPERILRTILPAKIDMVLDFSGLDQPSSIAALQGSEECINTKIQDLFGRKPSSGVSKASDGLHDELLKAHFVAANFVDRSETPKIVSLSQARNSAQSIEYPAVLDFTKDSEVSVQIAPINTKELFRSDKTYLLVGCTGGLGQALCRWMVQNGAKHLALTTRNPKSVNQVWLGEIINAGGNVEIFACDVTDGTSLRKTHEEISRKMPPIAGVANAAMVLADRLFNDITLEDFQISLKPKVDGTNQLDELFGEGSNLDFFILFSSLANTVGNRGQTNYLAANGYMQTIAAQRRARGLTASVMHIGMVIGIGVVSQDAALESSLKRQKWMAISEPAFLDMFAECILIGRPDSGHSNDIITGIPRNSTLPGADNPWYASNLRFSHMVLREEGEDNSSAGGSSLPIKQRLAAAITAEQRAEIIQADFVQKMSRILQAAAENIEVSQPLLALGVDSLMAMEIRSWFLSSIDIDMPVLKVLGGGSIKTLCAEAGALVKIVAASAEQSEVDFTENPAPPSEASASSGASSPSLLATQPPTPGLSEDFTWISRAGSETGEYEGVELLPGMERVGRMSFSQERLWFLQSFLTNPATYNITLAYRIKGPFRVADFNQAFYDLIDRHETLRTAFFTDKTNYLAYLGAVEKTTFVMVQKPYTGEAQIREEFNATNNHNYDLENAESMRATLLIESPTSHVLIMGFHHIAVDATSSQILVRDIASIYSGEKLAPLKYQYIDYANKQRATVDQALARDVAYWKMEFPDVPETLGIFDFGTVKSRKPLTEYNIRIMETRLDAPFTAMLKAASQKLRVTPFHLHLATLQTMLHKLLNVNDICIGITDANKNDPDHVNTLGFFVNLLPLRFKVEGGRSFAKLAQQARDKTLAALEHSQIPYNVLLDKLEVPRSTTSNPLFQVLMNYKMGSLRSVPIGECEAEVVDFQDASNPYDLQFDVELAVDGTTLITVTTQSYLYSEQDLSTVLRSYTHLLKTLSSKPSLPIKDQSVFSNKDAQTAVAIGTGPRINIDQSITINRMFDWAVKARSNSVAVVDNVGGQLTWIEMAAWISTISAHLLRLGVKPQSFVGVNCEPSAMSVCYWLAVLRIGAIYVPLDPSNPVSRLELIVNDCNPAAIICDEHTWPAAERSFRGPNLHIFKLSDMGGRRTHYTEDMSKPDETACVIYTSGTTGTPKGTLLTNSNFVNHIYGVNKEWDIGREVILQPTNLGFDLSLAQMMQFVASQGKLVVASMQTRTDPMELVNLMVEHRVTYTIVTPSVYALILRQDAALLQRLTHWRTAFSCGEPLTGAIVQQFQKINLPNLRLLNSCGPTEITIINSAWEMPLEDPTASELNMIVGSSLPNYSTYILDENLNPVPVGFPGEMVCGGASISQGYLGQQELTAAKWVPDPFASDADLAKGWSRMYRTGDRAKMLPDGRFVFLGRIDGDNQVKLRGVRIELDDIRSTVVRESKGAITEAAVCLRGEGDNAFLVAFAVLGEDIVDTRKFLAGLPLPSAMIPNTFVALDILPRTPNGKIDMRALAAIEISTFQELEDTTPIDLTTTEASLKEIWAHCLPDGISAAGARSSSDFFVLGGNSMLLVNVQALIRDTFNANIALYTLFQCSTLESMAAQIEAVSSVETTTAINWDVETALEPALFQPSPHSLGLRPVSRSFVEVILTGASGFLGTQILRELVSDERVGKVHCLAIRLADGQTSRALPVDSPKIMKYYGDLASPRLGLTDAQFTELSKKADRIIHNGCDVSFLKSYKSLSSSNLGSTKELVRLAMVRKAPLHFVSTAGVASFIPEQDLGERFIPTYAPPTDGSMGYAASKWAGEKYLLAAAEQYGLPIWVHRPANILGEGAASVNMTANILEYSIKIGAVPHTPGIDGHMQFVEVEEVGYMVVNALFARSQGAGAVVKNHCGGERIRIRELGTYLENKFGRKLATLELDEWVEEVQKMGLSVGLGSLIREVLRNSGGTASLKTLSRRRS
ncbi:hybrid PKS-NRPS protein [Diplocarpon rosae]|nr:hybrid PKS-NRPS protein [Diplocarpon rosae]